MIRDFLGSEFDLSVRSSYYLFGDGEFAGLNQMGEDTMYDLLCDLGKAALNWLSRHTMLPTMRRDKSLAKSFASSPALRSLDHAL